MVASTLLDQYGNPFKLKDLDEPQTERSSLQHLHQTFGTHPSRGLTPPKLAQVLEDAERGNLTAQCELFEDMEEKDAHIFAEMSKRKRALMRVDWDVEPPRNATAQEKKQAELVAELLAEIPDFGNILFDMADAIGKGFARSEIEWDREEGYWLPQTIQLRDPSWFQATCNNRNELRLRDNTPEGQPLRPFGWISHDHKAKSGYLVRSGLGRILSWPFLFKNYSVRDLAEFLEIYGLPLRIGKYPSGANPQEKATLLRAVVGIGHNAAGIIPQGMEIDFHEAAKGASGPFEAMMAWCERSQSKAILGGTLTSQADGKSSTNALGNVHNEVRQDLRDSDLDQLASTLTRDLLYPLAVLNGKTPIGMRRCPRLVFDTREPGDLKLYAEAIPKFQGMGMQISKQWAHDKTQIPEPVDQDDVLTPPAATPPPVSKLTAQLESGVTALKKQSPAEPDDADRFTDQLSDNAAPLMDGLIDPVRRLVMGADSLEQLRDGLLELYQQMDETQFAEQMQRALVAAELLGRVDVNEGN